MSFNLTKEESQIQATERQRLQEILIRGGAWQTCLNCIYWSEVVTIKGKEKDVTHKCMLFNATPPFKIIVTGCRDHEDDIPF